MFVRRWITVVIPAAVAILIGAGGLSDGHFTLVHHRFAVSWTLIAAAALLLTSPLSLLIALALKASSPLGPVLYRGYRVGRGGHLFQMLKFRTLAPDAEQRLGPYLGPELTELTLREVTRLGRLLRASKLDELPQLLNVLRGDMNIVGPRPERPTIVGVHQPPFRTGLHYLDAFGFRGRRALRSVVERHPTVGRVISGHIHCYKRQRWAHGHACSAPSTAPAPCPTMIAGCRSATRRPPPARRPGDSGQVARRCV